MEVGWGFTSSWAFIFEVQHAKRDFKVYVQEASAPQTVG